MTVTQFHLVAGPKGVSFIGLGDNGQLYRYDMEEFRWQSLKDFTEKMKVRSELLRPPEQGPDESIVSDILRK